MSHLPIENFKKYSILEITVANTQGISVHGMGNYVIKIAKESVEIKDVQPDLSANLISASLTRKFRSIQQKRLSNNQ